MEVALHSVIAAEVPGMPGSVPGDPAFERSGAAAVLAKRVVQAVSRAVIEQVELVSGYVAAAFQRVRLDTVHLDHAIKVAGVEVIDFRARQQLLDHLTASTRTFHGQSD
jgi:hypothetical protein